MICILRMVALYHKIKGPRHWVEAFEKTTGLSSPATKCENHKASKSERRGCWFWSHTIPEAPTPVKFSIWTDPDRLFKAHAYIVDGTLSVTTESINSADPTTQGRILPRTVESKSLVHSTFNQITRIITVNGETC